MMEAYWPTAGDSPDASRHDIDHSRWLNSASKLVFSITLGSAPWGKSASATLVTGDPAEAVQRLKSEPGADMLLIGSASLARTLIREGLIDEYRINVNPVMLGGGARLFPDAPTQGLELVASRTFGSGVVGLHYVAAR
jgi:dihydrofolate reductase